MAMMMVSLQRLEPLTSLHQATEHAWNLAATRSSPLAVWKLCSRFFAMAMMMVSPQRMVPLASLH